MKILFLASYITILEDNIFCKNITGFGHMVRDIADYVSRAGTDVDIVTMSAITKGRKYNSFCILRRTWIDILVHIKPYYLNKMIIACNEYRIPLRRIPKILFYFLSAGYIEHTIKHGNYDIVHIHGIGFSTIPFIVCCERLDVKFIVTLHGLNSFSDSVVMEDNEKQYEKDFLRYVYQKNIPMTVISSGILRAIRDYLDMKEETTNFHVILNGTNIKQRLSRAIDIRSKYGIKRNRKIMLCVGNLSITKNQLQIVQAYSLLSERLKSQLCIMFLGNDAIQGEIAKKINELGFEDCLILCGNVSRNEMSSFYSQADYTVLASCSEGFGLSIIEGFVYGLPALTFSKLYAVDDLFDPNAMIAVCERSDEALASGIVRMLTKSWNKDTIKKHGQKFSAERMAGEYIELYSMVINKGI